MVFLISSTREQPIPIFCYFIISCKSLYYLQSTFYNQYTCVRLHCIFNILSYPMAYYTLSFFLSAISSCVKLQIIIIQRKTERKSTIFENPERERYLQCDIIAPLDLLENNEQATAVTRHVLAVNCVIVKIRPYMLLYLSLNQQKLCLRCKGQFINYVLSFLLTLCFTVCIQL